MIGERWKIVFAFGLGALILALVDDPPNWWCFLLGATLMSGTLLFPEKKK